MVANDDQKLHQMDVKTVFLSGEHYGEIHMELPQGFVSQGTSGQVGKPSKALYGLKRASRKWFAKINSNFCNGLSLWVVRTILVSTWKAIALVLFL